MTFNSVPYLALLALAALVFWLLPARFRRTFVVLASVAFYASWGLLFVWLPLLVASIVYVTGRKIASGSADKVGWMRLGVSCAVVLLVFFKYRAFLSGILHSLGFPSGTSAMSSATSIAFPIGISFYTFEAIAYLVDLRQGRVKMPAFVELCLFFYFWPNILSGPIVRSRELMPQLAFQKRFEPRFVFEGLDRIVWGLVQKNVFANMLGIWVDRGFSLKTPAIPFTFDGWALAIGFALQIYFDFSGYTNLAIGAARLLGVTLPENFRQPYHAATPPEFWARWHMTLSRWVRDYLFFPINARHAGAPLRLYVSLLGVMALVGLWHGAGWGFVLWGTLHGCYLVLYRGYESAKNARPGWSEWRLAPFFWRVFTLVAATVAWVPFRAATLAKAAAILAVMFFRVRTGSEFGPIFYLFLAGSIALCAVEPWMMRKLRDLEEQAGAASPSPFNVVLRPIAYAFGLLLFLLFDEHNAQFIYSQF
ncbi:MAG TPA: MBOAT family O-acyltransferase [Candidatus Eisenbacteria bacterium]|nr:MBOAT family O-acyltransferase [Candidatus Eisenbacteria bacterium]